jgi:hypothetical protein
MKKRVVFAVLMIVLFMSFTISSAIGETDIKSVKRILLTYLIDDYIQKCKSKCKFRDSRSKNIRKVATLAALKAEYLNANKKRLIDEMAEAELLMKKYKVHHYLNAAFFNYYASKSNLQKRVIEAKLTQSNADDFLNRH